jgi:hypothetical protein
MIAPVRALLGRAPRTIGCLAVFFLLVLAATGVALACVAPAEPTTLTTSLSGESKSGGSITILEGSKVKDQATLEGKNAGKATGKISYAVYKDSSCKELVTKAGEFEFKEGKVPASEEKTLEGGKVYYWQAHYGGDSLDAESTSSCGSEVLTIKAATSLSTSLAGEAKSGESLTVLEGTGVKDKATLAGTNASSATGSVEYKVYKDSECKELATSAGTVTVSAGSVPESESKTLEGGKVYYWRASYGGDSLHQASTGTCGKEVLTVKAATVLSTSLSGEAESGETITVLEGAKVKDKATLTGTNAGTATGKVSFKVYKDSECKELETSAGEGSLSTAVAESEEKTLAAGHVYYWRASYGGDPLHEPSMGGCDEVETVKAAVDIKTLLTGEEQESTQIEVEDETPVSDTATLEGTAVSSASGYVEYFVYADPECEELITEAGKEAVSGGSPSASEEVALGPGEYFWKARYTGDSLHQGVTSSCADEVERVADATTLTTELSTGSESGETVEVEEGKPVFDTATLEGGNATAATGDVDYAIYADEACEELVAEAGVAEVIGSEVAASSSSELPPGTYYWQAHYTGDPLNLESTSACGTEVEIVTAPSLTTELSAEGLSGGQIEVGTGTPVRDTATLHEESSTTAGGYVEYFVYADPECKELVTEAGKVEVALGFVPNSTAQTLPAGVYYWQAVYLGDLTHPEATSECGSETELVGTPTSIATELSGEGHSGEEVKVEEGSSVTDTATITGGGAEEAEGTVEYFVYGDPECKELKAKAGGGEVASGAAEASVPVKLTAGTYYWQAVYFGDGVNSGSKSTCGSEIETVRVAALTDELTGGGKEGHEIDLESEAPVTDTAILHEESSTTAGGYVEYFVYADPECKELVTEAGKVEVVKGEILPSVEKTLPQGVYFWQAVYSGDLTHAKATSQCVEAVQRVAQNDPWIVSVGDSYISGEGGRWAGNVGEKSKVNKIDALRAKAYESAQNGEDVTGEAIPRCHRSDSAEIFIQYPNPINKVRAKNLACSGARTKSFVYEPKIGAHIFKPGLDFTDKTMGEPFQQSEPKQNICPIAVCKGQALLLREFATERKENGEPLKMVAMSIGGNDFGFESVVRQCIGYFELPAGVECGNNAKLNARFEGAELVAKRALIQGAIENVGLAMIQAGYVKADFTILVQDYPSPIPSEGSEFRYPPNNERVKLGGCAIKDGDANWANEKALKVMNKAVRDAANAVATGGLYKVKVMELAEAFNGRRLCEEKLNLVGFGPNPVVPNWEAKNAVDKSEWVNQVRLITPNTPYLLQEDLHPNYWGQLALRNCLRQAYNSGVVKSGECVGEAAGLTPKPVLGAPGSWVPEPKMKLLP